MKPYAQMLDKKIERIQWLSSLEDKLIIENLFNSESQRQKNGGMPCQIRKGPLL